MLFVALLVVVELSYRRWVRRASSRRLSSRPRSKVVIDLAAVERTGVDRARANAAAEQEDGFGDAAILSMPPRDASPRGVRRSG